MLRMLVLGKTGQIATSIRASEQTGFEVVCLGRDLCDITDRSAVVDAVRRHAPFVAVNAAAYTAVDKAEDDRTAAFALNRDAAGHVAHAANLPDLPAIHFSTDYVFSGNKEGAYVETDETGPSGAYGQSKLEGELLVAHENPRHIILRTAWVFSRTGHNFLKTILRLAGLRNELTIVHDQGGNPSDADDLAAGVFAVAEKLKGMPRLEVPGIQELAIYGTYHLCGPDKMSWADFAGLILKESTAVGGPSAKVRNITTAEYPTPAKRPENSSLDCGKFERAFSFQRAPLELSVRRTVAAVFAGS